MPPRQSSTLNDLRSAPVLSIRVPVRLVGFIVLGLIAICVLSLASWQVDDPSFSYATNKHAANWLGFPGAVIADLLFQLFGVAVIVALVPPALWGWNLVFRRIPTAMPLRALTWFGTLILLTGVCSFVAVPESWPLPTGLGGLIGMGFYALASLVAGGPPSGVMAALFSLILVSPTVALLWLSLGLKVEHLAPLKKPFKRKAPVIVDGATGDEAEPRVNPLMDVAIGAAVHLGFAARTAFRRAKTAAVQKYAEESHNWRKGSAEPQLADGVAVAAVPPAMQPLVEAEPEPMAAQRPIPVVGAPEANVSDDFYPDDDGEDSGHNFVAPALPIRGPMAVARDKAQVQVQAPVARTQAPVPSFITAPRVAAPAAAAEATRAMASGATGSAAGDNFGFELPSLALLAEPRPKTVGDDLDPQRLEANARRLEGVLEDFGVKGDIINVRPGPVVTLYELEPAPGIKSSRVISLADDIARSMSAISARVAVVQGRNAIGIELPNHNRETVYLREMMTTPDFDKNKSKLPICLGKTIGGEPIVVDLARMPHLLVAGTTGSGKSVAINTMILSLLYQMTPDECRLIMIDPKMLELSVYDGIPHLLTPVVTDPQKAVVALKWAVREMEDRYKKMSKIGVRNIDGFNQRVAESLKKGEVITRTVQTGFDRETGEPIFESEEFDLAPLPYIVVIVDEMADLMMVAGKDIEGAIQRLAQMARAAGIHLVTATQRPSVDVITGTIKANFPTRISFQVTSKIDSRTILGEQGAEQLLGMGDMLYMAGGGRIRRLHGPFVTDGEVEKVVNHLKAQGAPDYLEAITADEMDDDDASMPEDEFGGSGDELYDKAVNIVLQDKKASTSYIQRRLAIGYNRAATLVERMEKEGVISAPNHAGKREILVGSDA